MYELILTLLELQASGGVVPVGTPMPCTNCGGQALTAVTAASVSYTHLTLPTMDSV